MGRILRVTVAVVLLVALAGCNMVVSEEPWFTAADAVPEPTLRDGLWLSASADCRVDETKPAERWPDCASASFVRGEERWSMRWENTDERGRHRRTFVGWESDDQTSSPGLLVANGDHLIAQVAPADDTEVLPPDEAADRAEDSETARFTYYAVRPVRHDDEGKVTAFEIWPVRCGPLTEPQASRDRRRRSRHEEELAEEPNYVTKQPFPGLTVVDNDCVAESVDALRNAAVLSEALASPSEMRWVRDGWR
jgi:hypothetical protein